MVGDASIGEAVREVVGPELVFCKDHNLLMYPKSVMAVPTAGKVVELEDDDSSDQSESSDDDEAEADASDVEELQPKQPFH